MSHSLRTAGSWLLLLIVSEISMSKVEMNLHCHADELLVVGPRSRIGRQSNWDLVS